ncbi:putative spindle poison sensitivity protein Scp3 [Aspergillus lucknowensis]|uniref:C3H1-type domain-containing protein n=1 Tax=Aspergillus lucknowensis TaxID=176173 RepID=A0ABR4LEG3_9EURO
MQVSASRNSSSHPSQPSTPSAPSSRSQNRLAPEMKSRAPLPVPSGPQHLQNGSHSRNPSGFDVAARSPPNQSNTKHVPCKFFRQGACQAGPACPFLHSTDAAIEYAPCKYFTKGNCKFGAKCALAHILPDGRRVNRPSGGGVGMGSGHLNLGGRVNPQAYINQDSALTNSVLSQQRMNGHDARYISQLPTQEEFAAIQSQQQQQPQQPPYDTIPSIDTGLASDAGSGYGSPVEELRFPMSPNHNQYLTALDAPLPASFDSQGISHAARYGPVAASVPSRFGIELSPPAQRANPPSDALRNLRDAAYGSDAKKQSPSFIGSSPPGMLEDGQGPRLLHSQRTLKPRMLSSSVPRPTALDDWEDSNFPMEEDYLPMNLHDDVLTPQERLRRLSRTDQELSGLGMSTSFTKVNSPLASSPSRFGALFAKQRQKKEEEAHGSLTHLGSPLRESSMNFGSPNLGPIGSPPRNTSTSMISQQLSGLSLHPSSARHTPSVGAGANNRLDRTVSSPVGASKIDEEQGDLVFSMEEEENNKRNSASWSAPKTDTAEEPSTSGKTSDLQA